MTIHYHGTPITPRSVLDTLAGRHFCVSFAQPQDIEHVHKIGQSVMLDNGAYSLWKLNPLCPTYAWDAFYDWAAKWLDYQTTWAVIPDVINGTELENNRLIDVTLDRVGHHSQWAPVWHVHEPLGRLRMLAHRFERVCFGSSREYAVVGNDKWNARMNEAFNFLCKGSGSPNCWIHMLRGMSLAGSIYPFASLDSTDVARNHNRPQNNAAEMVARWDSFQNPGRWLEQPVQGELIQR